MDQSRNHRNRKGTNVTSQDSTRARILARSYERVDGKAKSKILVGNLETSYRRQALEGFPLLELEIPVLMARFDGTDRLLVTTQRLLLSQNGNISVFLPDEIRMAAVDLEEELRLGNTHKGDWSSMKIALASGETLHLKFAADVNLLGLVSAISWLLTAR